jgi:ABC-2 type transport system permease protein
MTDRLRLVAHLAWKDLRRFAADRRGALLCFAVPVLLASLFGAVFDRFGPGGDVRLPLLVVAEDDGPLTRRVVAALCASDKLEVSVTTRAAALERLAASGGGVAVVFPAGFGRVAELPGGSPPPSVKFLHHPASHLESLWAEGVVTEVVLHEAAGVLLAPFRAAHPEWKPERPFAVERTVVAGPGGVALNTYSHSFCGMTLQYLLFWGMDSGLLLLRERRQGIWKRMRVAPVPLWTLLSGKALATALVALLQIAVGFGFGAAVFGVRVTGSAPGFVALALAAALLSAATGLVVAALGGTESRARSVSILAILTLSMLGGLWLPSFLLPGWVQRASLALPTAWAARGLSGVTWQGMGTAAALRCAAVVAGSGVTFLALAVWGFSRSEARAVREGG